MNASLKSFDIIFWIFCGDFFFSCTSQAAVELVSLRLWIYELAGVCV